MSENNYFNVNIPKDAFNEEQVFGYYVDTSWNSNLCDSFNKIKKDVSSSLTKDQLRSIIRDIDELKTYVEVVLKGKNDK